ncbi:mucoidy inhibitor A [Ceratobasidium sp. AG-Ba]|nr:mucoidy inhibitor A [Ceratobasidium sp. AG-Ba]
MLTYTVSNASWTPLYDVRASIAKSPDAKSAMALHYRASITQTTGENWPDVALTLSTASPQLGGKVPEISTCYIGFQHPPSGGVVAYACLDSESPVRAMSAAARGPSALAMRFSSAEVVDNGMLSAVFGISGLSNVPSDEGSHKVVITVLNLAAQLEWMSSLIKSRMHF